VSATPKAWYLYHYLCEFRMNNKVIYYFIRNSLRSTENGVYTRRVNILPLCEYERASIIHNVSHASILFVNTMFMFTTTYLQL
jgi:hypothetical protein